MTQAYITGVGVYLPGDPIDNQQLADRFGDAIARGAALRQRAPGGREHSVHND